MHLTTHVLLHENERDCIKKNVKGSGHHAYQALVPVRYTEFWSRDVFIWSMEFSQAIISYTVSRDPSVVATKISLWGKN